MANWPTLTNPSPAQPFVEELSSAGDLLSELESGYKISRARFTRRVLTVTATYPRLNSTDRANFVIFINEVGTIGVFDWTHPVTSVVYQMRFAEMPKISAHGFLWKISVKLEQV